MKIYYYLKTTPMRFHSIVTAAAGFFAVFNLAGLFGTYAYAVRLNWIDHIDCLYYFVSSVLLFIAFFGLTKLSTWGWLSTMAFCGLLAIYSIYRILLGLFYLSQPAADFLLPVFCLICAVAVALYYYPRRRFFLVGYTLRKWSKKNIPFASFFANRCQCCCHKFSPTDRFCGTCGELLH